MTAHTHPALATLYDALRDLAARTRLAVKAGRTHLMDATPVTIGQEADAWAGLIERALERSVADLVALGELPARRHCGGHRDQRSRRLRRRGRRRRSPRRPASSLRTTANPMVHQGGQGALAEASSGLRAVAVALTKVANDIRLLASGPAAGLGELLLPELQAGSSIMPGKVNPVLCESVNQVAARVMGNDVTVGYAASQGILELNTYLPVMADALLESATLLGNVATVFAERCVAGIEVDEQRTRGYAERTSALATALNPLIGYERAAAIVKQAQASGRSIIDVVVAEGVLPGRRGPPRPRPAAGRRPRPRLTRRRSCRQEVGEQLVAAPREDALGVELHALDGVMAMAHAHHRPVVSGRRDDERRRGSTRAPASASGNGSP